MADQFELRNAELLARVDLFSGLDRITLAKLAARLTPLAVARGAVVVQEGDPGDAFYLVARGTFGVYAPNPDGGTDTRLAGLGPGSPFGEMALLANQPRSATVRAETDGEVLRLERTLFLNLVRREPGVALAVAATLSRRLAAVRRRSPPAVSPTAGGSAMTPLLLPAEVDPDRGSRAGGHAWRRLTRPSQSVLGGCLSAIVLAGAWVVPPPFGLPIAGWRAVASLGALVPLLALDVMPEGVLALLLPAVWVLGGVSGPREALGGFASTTWILVVSVLVLGSSVASCGVLYRLALWLVARTPGGYVGHVLALVGAGVLIGPAVPNATSRVALIAPVLRELVDALGYTPGSPAAAGLAMAALVGFGQTAAVFLTSSTTAVLVFAVLPPETRRDLTWLSWAGQAAPLNALLVLGLVVAVVWLYRPPTATEGTTRGQPEVLALQRALLGPPTPSERAALAAAAALVLGFATQPLHHVEPAWVGVLALAGLAATGAVTADTLRAVNWGFALFFGMLASLTEVLTRTQVDRWLGGLASAAVGGLGKSPLLFVLGLTLLCFVVSLVVRWQAAAPLMTIALAPVAAGAGISPLVVGLVCVVACNGFFVPYQSTTYLALYHGTEGRLFSHAQARRAAMAYGLATLLSVCASVSAWRLMGLL